MGQTSCTVVSTAWRFTDLKALDKSTRFTICIAHGVQYIAGHNGLLLLLLLFIVIFHFIVIDITIATISIRITNHTPLEVKQSLHACFNMLIRPLGFNGISFLSSFLFYEV